MECKEGLQQKKLFIKRIFIGQEDSERNAVNPDPHKKFPYPQGKNHHEKGFYHIVM